jgi:hypothetical protein
VNSASKKSMPGIGKWHHEQGGYNNIAEKYRLATGLRHSKVQLKNKLDLLKGL